MNGTGNVCDGQCVGKGIVIDSPLLRRIVYLSDGRMNVRQMGPYEGENGEACSCSHKYFARIWKIQPD